MLEIVDQLALVHGGKTIVCLAEITALWSFSLKHPRPSKTQISYSLEYENIE